MENKIVLITGAGSGIGMATAANLAAQKAKVIVVGRNEERARTTADEIRGKSGNQSVEYLVADLASQNSIRKMADEFRKRYKSLHVLINNAGLHLTKRQTSPDGFEMTFAVNHLAYFLLTNLLLDVLKASAPARIVNVTSEAHRRGGIDFNDLQAESHYSGFGAYKLSKLCNLLFTFELARRLQGTGVTVNALHPGVVSTGIFRDTPGFVKLLVKAFALSPEKGAGTMIHLASSPKVEGVSGKYFIRKQEVRPSHHALDEAKAQRLWDLSAEYTHL